MSCALGNQELLRFAFADELVDEAIGVVDASAPVAVKVLQRLGLADASVAIAFNVFDEGIDALQGFLVLKLPAGVFVPGARRKDDLHEGAPYASMSSWACPSPHSRERMDSARARRLAAEKNGSGLTATTSKGRRWRMTTCFRNRRTALDMSRPALMKNLSAAFRRSESTRTCSVDVAICSPLSFKRGELYHNDWMYFKGVYCNLQKGLLKWRL